MWHMLKHNLAYFVFVDLATLPVAPTDKFIALILLNLFSYDPKVFCYTPWQIVFTKCLKCMDELDFIIVTPAYHLLEGRAGNCPLIL